jgi:hypothetical protein
MESKTVGYIVVVFSRNQPGSRLPSRQQYQDTKNEWCGVPEVFDRQDVIEVSLTCYLFRVLMLTLK